MSQLRGAPKEKINIKYHKISNYIKQNTVAAAEGRKCVDGRYPPIVQGGMLARAGADCGYVMALLAVNRKKHLSLTPQECFSAVYNAITQDRDATFYLHTDHHADPTDQASIGCGHLAKAVSQLSNGYSYDIASEDAQQLIMYAKKLATSKENVKMVTLEGEHDEQGILIIDSSDYTVNAMNPQLHEMYFIYDRKRDEAFMKKLVEAMAIPNVTFEDMKKEADIQLQATLHNLAKGLPIYTVSYKDNEPQVEYLTTVS